MHYKYTKAQFLHGKYIIILYLTGLLLLLGALVHSLPALDSFPEEGGL